MQKANSRPPNRRLSATAYQTAVQVGSCATKKQVQHHEPGGPHWLEQESGQKISRVGIDKLHGGHATIIAVTTVDIYGFQSAVARSIRSMDQSGLP